MHSHLSLFQDKELELAKQCSQIFLNAYRTANLLNLRDALGIQNQWSRYQIQYIFDRNNVVSGLNSNVSSAAPLIQTLSNRNDTNFLYLTFEPDEDLIFITGEKITLTV